MTFTGGMRSRKTDEDERGAIISFRASPELIAYAEQAAAAEGISKSDVARRALNEIFSVRKQHE
jgi:hypothetical protein